jgi:hypothetical protein
MQPKSTDPELPRWVKAIFSGLAFVIAVTVAAGVLIVLWKGIALMVGL